MFHYIGKNVINSITTKLAILAIGAAGLGFGGTAAASGNDAESAGVGTQVALAGQGPAGQELLLTSAADDEGEYSSGLSDAAIRACLKAATGRPNTVSGIVEKNGKNARLNFTYVSGFPNQDCRANAQRTFKTWYKMQTNKGRYKRNSKVYVAETGENEYYHVPNEDMPAGSGKYADRGGRVPLTRRYTCRPGKKKRGIIAISQVRATYEGQSMTRKYKFPRVIATWKENPYLNTGKKKC